MKRVTEARVRRGGGTASTLLGCGVSWASGAPPTPCGFRELGSRRGRPLNSGYAAEDVRILRWVRGPKGNLWGPEGPHFRGEEES